MSFKYFNLNSECYLINGKSKAVIHNLLKKEVIWLDKVQTEIINKAESGELIDTKNVFLNELQKCDWGFFSEEKFYIDKLRTKNLFVQKKYYKEKPNIVAATIQLTNYCNFECGFCGEIYCPVCYRFNTDSGNMSLEKAKDVIRQLKIYGLKYLMITGGEIALYPHLSELMMFANKEGIKVIIYTNGTVKINNLNANTELYIYIYYVEQLTEVLTNYKDFKNVTIINYTQQDITCPMNWKVLKQAKERSKVELKHIQKLGITEFDLNKYNNACLNSRIYINTDLDVIHCFGNPKVIGNIDEDGLMDIILKLYNEVWNKNRINTEEDIKCKQCEFRFGCTNCYALGKVDDYCSYNTEVGQWM